MSIRTEKVAEEIKHQLAGILSRDLAELKLGLVTVTRVRISRDLKNAKAYVSFIGNKEPAEVCIEKINNRKKQIRMHLGKSMHLKFVPEIDFYFDDNMEYASRIDEIIKEIHKDEPEGNDKSGDEGKE
ncbi:MAG TPA: 30S ribosome-binding factor RbfA [Ignavibacteria bacterium]|nr:30S ribosome-binding factor RbfA [Ignavibacteria bacterium]HAX50171.1 30S ribosome-binding factor RbfA [Bacteroidota bacterium]HRE09226.1 30S ribosome-binding factor RbfA [Ignavibacteria bacterium]HRF66188.1 30S ribosome-binding factor RbfA [Ignavibacteria bacterium]HRJ05674.1 30S ribosome-binding factor RbfA [Ignavibacteria bacterium]